MIVIVWFLIIRIPFYYILVLDVYTSLVTCKCYDDSFCRVLMRAIMISRIVIKDYRQFLVPGCIHMSQDTQKLRR
jgi:hypothetical protein